MFLQKSFENGFKNKYHDKHFFIFSFYCLIRYFIFKAVAVGADTLTPYELYFWFVYFVSAKKYIKVSAVALRKPTISFFICLRVSLYPFICLFMEWFLYRFIYQSAEYLIINVWFQTLCVLSNLIGFLVVV